MLHLNVRANARCHVGLALSLAIAAFTSACTSDSPATPPSVASVTLDRTSVSVEQGKTSSLTATARDASGAALTGRTFSWSSDAAQTATVDQNGVVTGVSVGTTTIRATSDGKSATAQVTVTPIPVATVTLSANDVELDVGETATFTAELKSLSGQVLTGRPITWASADVTVVSIANGVVTAIKPGNTTISATSEGKMATANIVVKPNCVSNVATGRLTGTNGTSPFVYTTLQGWIVTISDVALRIRAPNNIQSMYYEYWGDNHENVGGKHIKDLLGDRRTLLLPGGVIITIHTRPGQPSQVGVSTRISIYEGNETHRINTETFSITHSCALPMFGESDEHDGETASILFNETGMRMENVYQQDATPAGVPLAKVFNTVPLAQTFFSNPNQVNDFYDDPRLGHTW